MTRTDTNTRLLIGTLLLASMLSVMVSTTISPALPAIQTAFSNTPNADFLVRLVLTVPALSVVILSPIIGAIVDRFGRRTSLLIASTVLYGLAGGAGYVIDSLYVLLVSRAILGIAVGGIMVTTTTLITDYFSGDQRETVLGWQGATINLGGIIFLSLGGILTDFGWRTPFLAYLSSLVLLPLLIVFLDEPTVDSSEASTDTLTTLTGVRRFLADIPVVMLGTIYLIVLTGSVLFYLMPIQIPFYLQRSAAVSGALTGIILASYNVTAMIFSSQFQWLKTRFGTVLLLIFVFGLMGAGYVIIGLSGTVLGIVIGLLVAGFGWGLLIPTANTWVSQTITEARRSRALGGVSSMIFLGQFLSPILSQPVIERVNLTTTFEIAGVGMLLLAVVFVIGNQRYTSSRRNAPQPSSETE
jgi:MFS family permease